MKLITEVSVDHFRSIRGDKIGDLGNFTVLAGLNNSGKSNLLRALNAFFRNNTDSGVLFNFGSDYYCHDLKTRKAKRVAVTVKFDLPDTFKFRKGLEAAKSLLGTSFTLRKVWNRNSAIPIYFLNESTSKLDSEAQGLIEQFLSLISFRYIPNRVMPLDIVRSEHKALRDVLIRRIASRAKKEEKIFESIQSTSANLIKSLQRSVHAACPDVGSIRLATPVSWQDLIFAFGYKIHVMDSEIDDLSQGSGIQSLLMFETLSLIDRDYFQKFGWRQAAIWAVEEPEASLHTSLEAWVANYLARLAKDNINRLQIFGTTHSDLILQYADKAIMTTMERGNSRFRSREIAAALQESAKRGISRWIHPILHFPLEPVILVEGKYDCTFLEQAFKLLVPHKNIRITYLERLEGGGATGGDKNLQRYIKANAGVIKNRATYAPVIVLLDWDSAKSIEEFKKPFSAKDPFIVLAWPEKSFNPELGSSFKGIERHMVTHIIDKADAIANVIAKKRDGTRVIPKDADYERLKVAVWKVIKKGIVRSDLKHSKDYLEDLLKIIISCEIKGPE